MSHLSATLKLLADPNRRQMIYILSKGEQCVCQLQQLLPLTQAAVSIQLKNLRDQGLICSRRQGKWVFYCLDTTLSERTDQLIQIVIQMMSEQGETVEIEQRLAQLEQDLKCL